MTTWLTRCFAMLLLVLPFVPAVADDPDDKEIARLVKRLDSSDFRMRDAATKRLKEIGEPALDALAKATTPLETRRRAEQIIAAIENKLYPEFCLPGHAYSVSLSADGKRLLAIDNETVRLWDAYTGKVLRVFEGHTGVIRDAALSLDGTRVLSGSGHGRSYIRPDGQPEEGDHSVRLWDAQTGKELCKYEGHTESVMCVAFGPEGQALSGDTAGRMHQWDLKTGKTMRIFACHGRGLDFPRNLLGALCVGRVAYSEKAKLAVTSGVCVDIRLWNLETGKEVRRFLQREAAYVCFSPDGKRLAGGFNHKGFLGLRIWDVGSGGELLGEPVARPEWPIFVAFSPNGKRIVTSNSDKTLRILDATSGKELYKSEGHAAYVRSAAFFPDGKRIASLISDYRGDTTVRIWRAPVTSKTRTRGERQ
jgi:WD40 repeat protein